jgi:hypothetical protein
LKILGYDVFGIEPIQLVSTWRNSRSGREGISKRLDRFLVAKKILEDIDRLKTWVGIGGS